MSFESYQKGVALADKEHADKTKREREAEDRKFEIEKRKHDLNALKLADKEALRNEQIQNISLNPNPVAPTVSTSAPQTTTMPIPGLDGSMSQPQTSTFPDQSIALPLPPRTIPGVYGPDTQVPVTSMQQVLQLQAEAERKKQLEKYNELATAAMFQSHATPEGGSTTFGVPGLTPTQTIQGQPKKPNPPNLQSKEGTIGGLRVFANFNPDTGTYTIAGTDVTKDFKPLPAPDTTGAAASRTDARLDKSYQYNDAALNKAAEPISTALARFGRLQDTINQATPQADALIAPELMTVMAGGQGSGLRINESEIARVLGGRSNFESLKAALNKWQLDPSKALSVTPAQREQIRALMNDVGGKLLAKQQIIEDSRQDLINADSVEDHRKIVAGVKAKLNQIDQGAPAGPPVGTVENGYVFQGGNPADQKNWKKQ